MLRALTQEQIVLVVGFWGYGKTVEMGLREDSRNRHCIGEYIQQIGRAELGFKLPPWFTVFRTERFNLWRLMRTRCKPRGARPAKEMAPRNRLQRRSMSPMGACAYNVPSLAIQAQDPAKQLWESMRNTQCVVSYANFYRTRYNPTPGKCDILVNNTPFAVQLMSDPLDVSGGLPSVHALFTRVTKCARLMYDAHSMLGQ